jgi:glycogen debranching enzyme
LSRQAREIAAWRLSYYNARTSNLDNLGEQKVADFTPQFYDWMESRALADIGYLRNGNSLIAGIQLLPGGRNDIHYQFARDILYFILQTGPRWLDWSRELLETIFALQGKVVDLVSEEQPGRMPHQWPTPPENGWPECIYMALDTTPMAMMATGQYHRWSQDGEFVERHWSGILAALSWIDEYGDRDGDGFVEYLHSNPSALQNQAWKDSGTAWAHADGSLAPAPIAPIEIQGWVYWARLECARLASDIMGNNELARSWGDRAMELKAKFNEKFWLPDLEFFAQGLDAEKRPLAVVSSNPGHTLLSGIIEPEKAKVVVRRLIKRDMLTKWGLRTLSETAASFRANSYHCGSVWPMDNWCTIAGAERYVFATEAQLIKRCLFNGFAQSGHLPELFVVRNYGGTGHLEQYGDLRPDGNGGHDVLSDACPLQAFSAGAALALLPKK